MVLKSPQHLEQILPLLRAFPDATFAITYRDPLSVVLSTATMLSYGDRVRRYQVNPKSNFNYWHDRIKTLLERFTADYKLIPLDQKSDVFFHDLIKDNIKSVKDIYSKNSFKFNALANGEIEEYIKLNKRGKHGQVIYNLEDFDVDESEFYESFKFYFDTFDVLKEI